jgi:hypothetical protein
MSEEGNSAMISAVGNVDKKVTEFQTQIVQAFNQMFEHVETMAGHIISLEAMMGAVAATHPIDAAKVEAYVRNRVGEGTDGKSNADATVAVTRAMLDRITKA